jgi:hydroxymethylbilane synthase
MSETLRLGTRGSPLALAQAALAAEALAACGSACETVVISTDGDRRADAALGSLGPGAFASALEQALVTGEIDIAVHSAKDLTGPLPEGLALGAFLPRADPRDAWCGSVATLAAVPTGGRVGTSSLRRTALLRTIRPDLEAVPIRGNVQTRLEAVERVGIDGVILAACGLDRLGIGDRIGHRIPIDEMLPESGQGAIALQVRTDDAATVERADHPETRQAVLAERLITRRLGGGCRVPVAAHATRDGSAWRVIGWIGADVSADDLRYEATGDDVERLAVEIAEVLLAAGGAQLLAEART